MEGMCRICLVENVRMHIVVDKVLHELYETLTDIPPNPSVNQGQLACTNGLTVTPVENISIVDVGHIESIAVKEELPAVCERLDDVIEPEEEHYSDDLKLENVYVDYSNVENTPALRYYESNSEDDVPLTQVKAEVQEVPRKERRASDATRAAVVKKQTQPTPGKILEDIITENKKKKEDSVAEVTQNTQKLPSKHIPEFQEPLTNTTPRVDITVIDTTSDTNGSSNITKHNLTEHTRIRTSGGSHKCDICQYTFKNKTDLLKHICFEKPFQCEYCQRGFIRKSSLKQHIRKHTGEKPFKDDECQNLFNRQFNFIKQFRRKLPETRKEPLSCEYCQKSFSYKSNLTTHIRTHSGEKPYQCEECQLRFTQKAHLESHILIHTGEKPFKCEECQRCFIKKFNLLMHIRRNHAGEKLYK